MGIFSNLFGGKKEEEASAKELTVCAPIEGKVIPLAEVNDEVFRGEMLGKGCAIEPAKGVVVAPFDGEIEQVPDTLHAVGIMGSNGIEVLIHVGMDTVELKGAPYTGFCKEGDKVKKGQKLLEFDMDAIKAAGLALTTPVIVTNTDVYTSVERVADGDVSEGTVILKLEK